MQAVYACLQLRVQFSQKYSLPHFCVLQSPALYSKLFIHPSANSRGEGGACQPKVQSPLLEPQCRQNRWNSIHARSARGGTQRIHSPLHVVFWSGTCRGTLLAQSERFAKAHIRQGRRWPLALLFVFLILFQHICLFALLYFCQSGHPSMPPVAKQRFNSVNLVQGMIWTRT